MRHAPAGQLGIDYRDALPQQPEQITIFAALPASDAARLCQLEIMLDKSSAEAAHTMARPA